MHDPQKQSRYFKNAWTLRRKQGKGAEEEGKAAGDARTAVTLLKHEGDAVLVRMPRDFPGSEECQLHSKSTRRTIKVRESDSPANYVVCKLFT